MTERITYRSETTPLSLQKGLIKAHVFNNVVGPESVIVPEHSVLLVESDVTITDIWDGQPVQRTTYHPGMIRFLPAGTELSSQEVSQPYSESMIRIPEQVFRDASRGQVDYDSVAFRFYTRHTTGLTGLLLKRMFEPATPPLLIESISASLAVSILCDLCAKIDRNERSVGMSPERRRRLIDYIEANLAEPLTLNELADVACISPYHLIRCFKTAMGVTPFRYIQTRRIEYAKRMLTTSGMRMADIAYACGFGNQSHFTTAFKEATGHTPTSYRRAAGALIASLFLGLSNWLPALELAPMA